MRLQRLQIPAFGPFTNLELRFPDQPGDLHVIYGANEAGKSSLLRAIRDLLFGIPSQSGDNFRHDYADLRVRAEVRNRDGQTLVFQRRKGNKNTLLDAEGRQLPDNALAPYLGPVDQAYFSAMFGLGARELREGAQQLLRGEGDIGTALFSASMGGTPVQKVVAALQAEAEGIFKGRASANVTLRPASARYKDLLKQSREAMVNPETWERLERELGDAEIARLALETEIARLDRDLQWLVRCEDALPAVGRLGEERQKLAQLPPLPEVAADFVARAVAARAAVEETQNGVQRLTAQITKLQAQQQACHTAPAVLAVAEALEQLHQDSGAYREQGKSLADLQVALAGLEPQLRAGMQRLQLTGELAALEGQRLGTPARLACEEAASALKARLADQAATAVKLEELQSQIHRQEAQLRSLPETDLTLLREALAVAAEATDADRTHAAAESEVKRLLRESGNQHRQIAGAPGDFDATAALAVPAAATIRRHHEQMEGIRREQKTEAERLRDANKRAAAIRAELGRLQRQGELPSEETLRQARGHRDRGWGLVLAEWKGGGAKEPLVPGLPLEEAFPEAITQADGVADQLRLHAEAVAQAEEKRAQLVEIEQQLGEARRRAEELQGAWTVGEDSWRTEWTACGITPRSPAEMEEWRDQWSEFRGRLEKLRAAEESLEKKRRQIHQARLRLAAVLGQAEEKEFSLLFAAARELVQQGEQASGRRLEKAEKLEGLKSDLARVEQRRGQLQEEVGRATENWKTQCVAVGLPAGTSQDAGMALLRERKDLLAQFDQWRELSHQAAAATEATQRYDRAVREQAGGLGLAADSTTALETTLWKALTGARQAQTQSEQLAGQIQKAAGELEEARARALQAERGRDDLIQLAGLTAVAELEPLLAHLEQRRAVQAQIDNLRNTLGGLARGQPVDEFVASVRAENPDALAARKAAASREKDEKEARLTEIREVGFRLGNEKKALEKAGDAAAAFRQQAESCAATLRQEAARYLRLRVAMKLLQGQIERFRKENQGPLLQKSGDVFRAITRGAFSGLGADFRADDSPVLVGLRTDETKVPVEGMSDGTRDQLFLALRLAALERHLAEHEPMPLIMDDLLITFDDDRVKAILPQLATLAQRTQIFLFTHHEHLVELCGRSLGEGQFHLHRLGGQG